MFTLGIRFLRLSGSCARAEVTMLMNYLKVSVNVNPDAVNVNFRPSEQASTPFFHENC